MEHNFNNQRTGGNSSGRLLCARHSPPGSTDKSLQTSAQDFLRGTAADSRRLFRRAQLSQTIHRRADNVAGVIRAKRLGTDILDTGGFDHRTHRAAGDNAGTREPRAS